MFSINAGTLELILEIVPVESLLIHERTIPSAMKKLAFEFKNWASLQNPIIVDQNHIVLDGNHRAAVFKNLMFKYIPVCKIDYFNDSVQLRYWFRLIKNLKRLNLINQIIEGLNGHIQQIKDEKDLKTYLIHNPLYFGMQQGNYYGSIDFPDNIVNNAINAYDILEKIQDEILNNNLELEYVPDQHLSDNNFCNMIGKDDLIIWTPHITKKMVVDAAKEGKIFAPKTTRHIIPARPLNVNVPSNWFKENISLDEINKRFIVFLENKNIRHFGSGQVIDGRYYEDELYFFYDKK